MTVTSSCEIGTPGSQLGTYVRNRESPSLGCYDTCTFRRRFSPKVCTLHIYPARDTHKLMAEAVCRVLVSLVCRPLESVWCGSNTSIFVAVLVVLEDKCLCLSAAALALVLEALHSSQRNNLPTWVHTAVQLVGRLTSEVPRCHRVRRSD